MRVCFSELNGKIQEKLIQNEKKTRRKTDEVTELLSSLLKIAHGHLNKKQNENKCKDQSASGFSDTKCQVTIKQRFHTSEKKNAD